MIRKIIIAGMAAGIAALGLQGAASAAGGGKGVTLTAGEWSFDGPFGHYDQAALQRGFQVYREVCSSCHGVKYIAFRNLADLGYNQAEIAAIAADYEVMDGPDDEGEMYTRPARPSDYIPGPFRNDNEARASNNGSLPPDLSLMAKARANGPNYIYSLLISYKDAPRGDDVPEGMHYNLAYDGNLIAMAQPLYGDDIEYSDGSPTTIEGLSSDVTNFMMWTAEPKLEIRKRIGVAVVFFLSVFLFMTILAKRRIWAELH